jgi:hypothetical protein
MLRRHILTEDGSTFVVAATRLPAATLGVLSDQFVVFDEDLDDEGADGLADRLVERYGACEGCGCGGG